MSWSRHDRGGPRYHHGNLKEALLRAALELIAQKGPAGFTFAEAARWAGVSPAAPYRHFRDRDELLASVALRGFERFAIVLEKAWDDGRPQPLAALDRLGKAYLEFARTEPAYYSEMFEAGISLTSIPELREAGERAFAVLRGASEMLCAQVPPQSRPPALMVALHIWAMSHGIASLFGRGDAARRTLPIAPEEAPGSGSVGLPARPRTNYSGEPLLTVGRRDVNVIYIHSEVPSCLSQQGSMNSENQPGSC